MQIQIIPQDKISEFIEMRTSSIESKSSIQKIALVRLEDRKTIGISL